MDVLGKNMLTRKEVLERVSDKPWVSPFDKIISMFSPEENLVQVYEYHARNACFGAAAWAVYHYKQTSPLVLAARRDGARDIFTLKVGESKLNLKPSFSSAGIESVKLVEDSKLREQMGQKARETVKHNFLLTRYLEQYLDLFNSIHPVFELLD